MSKIEEKVEEIINDINLTHDSISKTNWGELNREGFVFELDRNSKKLKSLYLALDELNRSLKLLLEKGTPSLDNLISNMARELTILDSNLNMERSKKIRENLINEKEKTEVPELYSSIQRKMISLILRARYETDKVKNFLSAKKMPYVKKGSTAKALIEILQKKEDELKEAREKNLELKRKTFLGQNQEKSLAELEKEINESDKKLEQAVIDTTNALKNHLAQITYVEGSFAHLKKEVDRIENLHSIFSKKSVELIKELKKERDYSRTLALEIEDETIKVRSSYTHQLIDLERKKSEIEEKAKERYVKEISDLKKELSDKSSALINLMKLVDEQEKEIKRLKK